MRKALPIALVLAAAGSAVAGTAQYTIIDMGIVNAGDAASQAFRVSSGGIATGRSFGNPTQAFTWTQSGGQVGLPNLAGRDFSVGNSVNDSGVVVGTGSTTPFGSAPLPLIWQNGMVSQLPMPAGFDAGRANDINASGMIVGSVGGGINETAYISNGVTSTAITATSPEGFFFQTAFSINDSGRVVGVGLDPNNAAVTTAMVYDSMTGTAFAVPALPGDSTALAFDVSNAGHVVGSSGFNGMPFIWSDSEGTTAIPLPLGASTGSARGVNSAGMVVGNAGGTFAVPFFYDGVETHRIQDLIDPASGWDLSMNTSSSALGISEDGIIVGTGIFNGETRAYALVPVPTPGAATLLGATLLAGVRRRR